MSESTVPENCFVNCPVCNREFDKAAIEEHVNKCLFLNTSNQTSSKSYKRTGPALSSPFEKCKKINSSLTASSSSSKEKESYQTDAPKTIKNDKKIPLAEAMRPNNLDDIIGQKMSFGSGSMLHSLLEQKKIPNMILWGPPGCGKTSLANVVSNICKEQPNLKFVKLSATTSGTNNVKEIVKIARNDAQYKKQTILFMDEIHRFNKLQQDTFLPHVEDGTITLIGATTENPSFSLNNALLSRCRVVVMEKLTGDNVMTILKRAVEQYPGATLVTKHCNFDDLDSDSMPRCG